MRDPVASPDSPAAFDTPIEGTWLVQTPRGIVALTLDQLDQAFQRGEVHASTSVFTMGMTGWDTLGKVANLDADAGDDDAVAAVPTPREPPAEPFADLTLEPMDNGSLAPTTTGVFGMNGLPWASITPPENGGHTVVRRSAGASRNPFRRVASNVADAADRLRRSHTRLGAAGPWLFGAALSAIFVVALYQVGTAVRRPGAHTKSVGVVAPALDARPLATGAHAPTPASASPSPNAVPERLAARPTPSEPTKANEPTQATEPTQASEPMQASDPTARAKLAKASAKKKARARAHGRVARRAAKRRSTSLD